MNWDHVERMWKQDKGKVKEKWGKLTDDDLKFIDGRRDRLEGKIQQRYGFAPDHVRKEVDDWVRWQTPVSSERRSRTARSVKQQLVARVRHLAGTKNPRSHSTELADPTQPQGVLPRSGEESLNST